MRKKLLSNQIMKSSKLAVVQYCCIKLYVKEEEKQASLIIRKTVSFSVFFQRKSASRLD